MTTIHADNHHAENDTTISNRLGGWGRTRADNSTRALQPARRRQGPANPWASLRVGEASNPGPVAPGRRQRALHALAQMGLNPTENVEFYTYRAGEERPCGGRAHAGRPVGSGTDTPPSSVEGVAPASWTRRGPPQHLPAQNAPRSWLFVPLLLDTAGQLHVAASAAWRSHAVLGAHWGSWLAQLRGAPPVALDQARAAVSVHQALDARPVQWWPHKAFEGMRGDAPCSLPLLVARCQAPDGYLLAPFQEALLQLYGGASLAAEIAGTADAASAGADLASRMPCPGPAALAPRDDAAAAPPEARRGRSRRAGSAGKRSRPPGPTERRRAARPSPSHARGRLGARVAQESLHAAVASRPNARCPEGRADRRPDRGTARPELSGRLEALPSRPAHVAISRAWGNARATRGAGQAGRATYLTPPQRRRPAATCLARHAPTQRTTMRSGARRERRRSSLQPAPP